MLSGCTGTARHVDDRQAGFRSPIPAQIVRQSHGAGWIALHGMDAAVGRASAARDHGQRLWSEPIDPLVGGDRLAGLGIGAHRGPVAFFLNLLVGHGAFEDQDERVEFSRRRLIPIFHEVVADFISEDRVMEVHLWQAGNGAHHDVLDAGQGSRGDRDGIAVAAKPGGHPDDVNFFNSRGAMSADFSGLHRLVLQCEDNTSNPLFCRSDLPYFREKSLGRRSVSVLRLHASDQGVAAKLGKVHEDHEADDQQQSREHGFRLRTFA